MDDVIKQEIKKNEKRKKEMKMRRTIVLALAIFLVNAFAFSEVKIGVINPQKIMDSTKKGISIQKRLEKLQGEKQQKIQALQDEIKKLQKDLTSPALNNDARQKKNIELQERQKNFKRYVEDARNEFARESQKEFLSLEKELMPLIENLGRQKGFTIIIDVTRPGIVYYDEAIDITADVVKAVDAKYPG
jgi:outer membrane protein